MLRRNKSLSIIMALCLCLALLAPVFVAPPAAEAASTATVVSSNQVGQTGSVDLGVIKVKITDFASYPTPQTTSPWVATVSFPTKLATVAPTLDTAGTGDTNKQIYVTYPSTADNGQPNALGSGDVRLEGDLAGTASLGTFDVKVASIDNTRNEGVFYIHFTKMDTRNFAGDVLVNMLPGSPALDQAIGLKIATVNAADKTQAIAKSVRKVNSSGGTLDNIIVTDLVPGSIKGSTEATGDVTLEMESKGFYFVSNPYAALSGYWRFDNSVKPGTRVSDTEMTFPLPDPANNMQTKGMFGLVNVKIGVDEKVAKVGQDIEVTVKGPGITTETLVVGQYVDYLVNITLDKSTELIAGRSEQTLGTFFIEEVAPGTLVADRTILVQLPAGVEWNADPGFSNANFEVVNNSAITLKGLANLDKRTLKIVVGGNNDGTGTSKDAEEGAKILFKKLKVDVSPSFSGDVVLQVSGKAGAEGEVTVSKVIPMITMEAATPELKLGIKEQKVADVVITESKANALVDQYKGTQANLAFYLDQGFRFAKVPKVEVLEGDIVLELNDVKITTPRAGQNVLIIPIRAGSYKTPAKIKISDIYVTADRTAPTGEIAFYAAEVGIDSTADNKYFNAFNNTFKFHLDSAGSVYVANNTTVPPVENAEVGSGTFVIGSNLYTVNGVTRVMDVAPYIKNDRTYVPYRYLAYVLGVAEEDVVWDQSAQTVTLTAGDTTVVATIGSTTLTVNGESVVMDVAPEIYEGRTMLPARWLAEALGATVGWDNTSRTVVVEF